MIEGRLAQVRNCVVALLLLGTGSFLHVFSPPARDVSVALIVCAALVLRSALANGAQPVARVRGPGIGEVVQLGVLVQLGLGGVYVLDRLNPNRPIDLLALVTFVILAVVAVDAVRGQPALGRWSHWALAATFVLVGTIWVVHSQHLTADVVVFQEQAANRLLSGRDPYLPGYPDIYAPSVSARFYGPGLSVDGILQFGIPYPPVSVLLSTGGALLGDVRLAHVFALAVAGVLLATVVPSSWHGRAGAALLLTTPSLLHMIENAWTEAFVVATVAWALWSGVRTSRSVTAALAGLIAVKQYAILVAAVLILLAPRLGSVRERARRVATAAAVAILVSLPLALWHPHAFWLSVVELQLRQPLRLDGLSLPAVWGSYVGEPPAVVLTLLLLGGTVTALWWALTRTAQSWEGAVAAAALVFLVFVLLAKQAFVNYDLVVTGLLTGAVASAGSRASGVHDGVE